MATSTRNQMVCVLVGPTCPRCESDELRWADRLARVQHGQCRDCGTEYRWYQEPEEDRPEPVCPGCGVHSEDESGDPITCEDCGPSDCVYCGATVYRWQLSEHLACAMCEGVEAA